MYGDFSETATGPEIAELGTILDTLTGITCDALEGAETVAGVTVTLVAAGTLFEGRLIFIHRNFFFVGGRVIMN